MGKNKIITSFFKRKNEEQVDGNNEIKRQKASTSEPVNEANEPVNEANNEVGDSWFCVMIDESRDESKKEQMAIVLRFVDVEGVIRERFLDLVHVMDTLSATLKVNLWNTLLHYNFDVSKIRGQGYDGASNMRGEWNGLQALVREYSPYAYYVHCFAHRLQLALVCVSRDVTPVHQFFSNLVFIINVVCASSKRHDELQMANADEIKKLLELGEIKSGKGQNQVGTLLRAGDTRWGSHFKSICSLVNMFDVTHVVLKGIIQDTSHATGSQRGDANIAYSYLQSFEFVLVLHLMKEVMAKTETLSQALQKKSQDILNAMELVSATKKNNMYKLVERVCRLILTLPVSTATTERGFSAMKIFKNRLRNKMSNQYLANSMVIYIEKEIAENFDSESIIEEFKNLKGRRAEL
ncbi:zinc finger MYM-type protein 1-like [Helianthus annuus]|uniref:zinc finger MYM-type protein 1-like n=1 Tax=Helianthus annuus TaxID=4232 RepID=UPI00165323AC|nr:zinc finger MYM-type protein 1-like [Helianthus annuus]